jgi:putative membrane protein
MKFRGLLALACAGALMAGCHNNRTSNTIATSNESDATGTAGTGVSTSDKNWVNDQLAGGMAEVDLAKVAKDHAASAEVKQFAQMMIDDHTKAGNQLKQIATTYAIPTTDAKIDNKHQNLMDKLSKLSGRDFDKEYMSAMIDDHQDAVGDLRSRVDEKRSLSDHITGKNPENPATVKPEEANNHFDASVNQWAADTLPTVEHHLDRAKQIKDSLDSNNRTARGTSGTKAY